MMNDILYSIDCGTQSLRVLLFSIKGELLAKEKIEYDAYVSSKPGWAEQDPELWYSSLCQASKSIKKKHPELFARIAAVGITTQRDSMINIDENGKPLRNAVLWLDQRKSCIVYRPKGLYKTAYKLVGMDEAILKTQKDGISNWIRQNQAELWEKTAKYVQVSGFFNYRLTGEFYDSIANQIGHIPFNYKHRRWYTSKRELSYKMFPVEKEKLPELKKPGEIVGYINSRAEAETGLQKGTPVIACSSDKGSETLGMGILDIHKASLSFGTTATIQTTSKKYFEPLQFMPAYPAAVPDHYNPEVEIFRGYWMISWFKNEFAHKEVLEAQKQGIPTEVLLNKYLQRVPAGSMGLMVQPYWSPGLKEPSAKGSILGFGDVHKKEHVYKAVIEGLAFALRDGMHAIERQGHTEIHELAVSGGAAQSDEICQISCDIFNKPLVRGKTFETAGLGAAITAAVGAGLYASFTEAIDAMVEYEREFLPQKENVKLYNELYHRVYTKIYKKLRSLYKEIREITNYPERIQGD